MYIPTYLKVFVCIVFKLIFMRAGRVTTLVICSYVIVSWLRWWIPQMTCGKLFLLQHSLATSLLEQKKNLFWRLPSWVNLLSLFLVKNEDVSVWFNIIWLGMQIEIRVKYQGWSLYGKKLHFLKSSWESKAVCKRQ